MIQTRYFFTVLLGVLSLMLIAGVTHDSSASHPQVVEEKAVFITPKESYSVVPYVAEDPSLKRTAFIAKVRSALLRDLSLRKVEEVPEVVVAEVPMPSIAEGSLNYGDAIVPAGTSTLLMEVMEESLVVETPESATSSPQR
jgi:hypothetical protein